MIINRILNSSGKEYFFNIESSGGSDPIGKTLKIIATDGRIVWESFKSNSIKLKGDYQ